MDLSKLSIEPRLRNGWQAIDLGFVMARRWWWPCFLAWGIPSFVVLSVSSIVLHQHAWIVALLVWWLKPLWDRLPLLIASRALFGEPPQLWSTLRSLPWLIKTDLIPALTYRRLSLSRSFDLPVTVLEGLRKDARTKRLTLLHQTYGNSASMLTLVCVHVEMFVSIGIVTALIMLVPKELQSDPEAFLLTDSLVVQHASNVMMWLAMATVAPFYCLAGFSLYINRRIELEGWDIEVRFRHLLARHTRQKTRGRVAAGLLPLVVSGLVLFHPGSLEADEAPEFLDDYYHQLGGSISAAGSKQSIVEVLSSPDFFNVELESKWRFKDRSQDQENNDAVSSLLDWLEKWYDLTAPLRDGMSGFAGFFEFAVWLLLAALVAYLFIKYRHGLVQILRHGKRHQLPNARPELLFGLDVREESLPDDVGQQVMSLWDGGKEREALGLLYRATLSRLIHQNGFQFYAGFTEQECVAVVAQSNNTGLTNYLRQLTRVWQRLAYAHQLPLREQVTFLCTEWQRIFEEARHAA